MQKNALIITNRVRKIPGGLIECYVKPLQSLGFNVIWAADFSIAKFDLSTIPCDIEQVNFRSNPFNFHNFSAYKQLNKIIKSKNIKLIHCNTPIGGLLGRIVGHRNKVPCIIYKAHGFLFFKNGPRLGFLYRLVEKFFCRFADCLITINDEDYKIAKTFKLRNESNCIFKVHGSGMNLNFKSLSSDAIMKKKKEIGVSEFKKILISIGELNKNKNVKATIKSLCFVPDDICLLVCGEGNEKKKLVRLTHKLGLSKRVFFLGYRLDVHDLIQMSDIYVSSSLREGLSRTVSESMAAGKPCIVSNRRGLNDLVDENGGILFEPNNCLKLAESINSLSTNSELITKMGNYNLEKIKEFTSNIVSNEMKNIYSEVISKTGVCND